MQQGLSIYCVLLISSSISGNAELRLRLKRRCRHERTGLPSVSAKAQDLPGEGAEPCLVSMGAVPFANVAFAKLLHFQPKMNEGPALNSNAGPSKATKI